MQKQLAVTLRMGGNAGNYARSTQLALLDRVKEARSSWSLLCNTASRQMRDRPAACRHLCWLHTPKDQQLALPPEACSAAQQADSSVADLLRAGVHAGHGGGAAHPAALLGSVTGILLHNLEPALPLALLQALACSGAASLRQAG